MLRKILGILAVVLMLGYMVFAIVTYSDGENSVRCKKVIVVVKDSAEHQFVRAAEVQSILKSENVRLIGKRLSSINYASVEAVAASHKLDKPSGVLFNAVRDGLYQCLAARSGIKSHEWL
jgi:hypothetical protein